MHRTRFATAQAAKIESTQGFRQDLLGLPSPLRPPVLTVLSLTSAPSTPHKTIRVFQTPQPESLGSMPIPGFGALGRLRGALLTPNPHPSCRVPSLPAGHYPHLRPALSQAGSATMNPSDSLTCFGHHFTLAAYRLPYLRLPPQNRPRPPRVTAPTLPNRAVPNHPIHLSEARFVGFPAL